MKFQAEASAPIPPWKLELLSRKSALARAIEPNLSQILNDDKPHQVITTTWKEMAKDGAVPNKLSVSGSKRPLSGETLSKTNGFYENSSSTCATLFNGDGCSGESSGISPPLPPRSSASSSVVRVCEGGASSSATTPSAPLSPSSSSLDWSHSSCWPAHRPSRLDFRTLAATDKQAAVNPPPPANRDQFNLIDSSSGVVNALPTKRILFDEEPGSPRHQARPPIVRNQQRSASLKMGEDNAVTSAFPTTDKSDHVLDELATDSDSSEEIHYGPGFVSRLKSRYMSAALRSSSTPGGLRRTASLEDFLDKDKEEVSIELSVHHQPPKQSSEGRFQRKSSSDERSSRSRTAATGVASHVNRKARESIKRCQSVEVLARNKLEDSKPPPLPPKSTTSHMDTVLNSEALANDNVQLSEKSKARSSDTSTSSTVIASLRRPFAYRRRSAGLLFGVEEKELPAPDTVKETRKIFETKSGTHTARPALIKSRSTSSLYNNTKSSSPVRNYRQQKSVESKKPLVSNTKPALPAKPKKNDLTPIKKKNKFEVPPLRHVQGPTSSSKKEKKNESIELEEGIKIVSQDSINKIRQAAGESFSFNFNKSSSKPESTSEQPPKPAARKPYLPNKKCSAPPPPPPSKNSKVDTIDNATVHAVPVGVIKPISRVPKEDKKTAPTLAAPAPVAPPVMPAAPIPKRAESPTTTLNNLINLTKQTNALKTTKESSSNEEEKEVILIDKKHDLEPILKTATAAKASHNTSSNRVYASKIVTFAEDLENKRPAPPPASSLPVASSPTKDNSDEGIDYEDDDMENSKSNYRDSWKKRQEAATKNTMVFNFLNSQKDVTHIENDGLDLSKRKKNKQHLQQMSKVRSFFPKRASRPMAFIFHLQRCKQSFYRRRRRGNRLVKSATDKILLIAVGEILAVCLLPRQAKLAQPAVAAAADE